MIGLRDVPLVVVLDPLFASFSGVSQSLPLSHPFYFISRAGRKRTEPHRPRLPDMARMPPLIALLTDDLGNGVRDSTSARLAVETRVRTACSHR